MERNPSPTLPAPITRRSTSVLFHLIEQMSELLLLGLQITAIVVIGCDLDRHALDDVQPVAVNANDLLPNYLLLTKVPSLLRNE